MTHETLGKFKSSNVQSAKYYPHTHTLVVTFKGSDPDGTTYNYHKITPKLWEGLQEATSKGSFLQQSIIPKHKGQRQK